MLLLFMPTQRPTILLKPFMLKKIIGTTSAKGFNAVLYLLIVLLSTNTFGTEGHGKVSLFVMAVGLNATLAGLIVYSIIYLTSRSQIYKLATISYFFSTAAAFLGTNILHVLNQLPEGYYIHTLMVSIICGIFQTNQQLLVGLGRIKDFNFISIVQVAAQLGIFAGLVFSEKDTSISAYMLGMGLSQFIGTIPSAIILSTHKHSGGKGGYLYILKEGFRYGSYSLMSNLAQLVNYRLPSYLVKNFIGVSALGVYSAAIQIAESIWLICRSFAMVVLSDISRSEISKAIQLKTIRLMRISIYLTSIFTMCVLIVPSEFYQLLLGKDFTGIKPILWILCSGILAFSAYSVLTAYFAGIGRPDVNTAGSFIGAVVVTGLGLLLTPALGSTGAAISSSMTHLVILGYTIYRFNKHANLKLKDHIAVRNDAIEIRSIIKNFVNR